MKHFKLTQTLDTRTLVCNITQTSLQLASLFVKLSVSTKLNHRHCSKDFHLYYNSLGG